MSALSGARDIERSLEVVGGVRASCASIVDPEALVVATAEFGRWDARLFDEMLDWLVANAAYVDWASTLRGVTLVWRELQTWPEGGDVGYAEVSRLVKTLGAAAPDLAAEGFECHIPDLRGWAAREADIPGRVVEDVARRIEEFVR